MSQLRRHSFAEACLSTATGFLVSYAIGLWVFPAFNFPVTPVQNLWIVSIFTLVSIVRQYIWRRVFNYYHTRGLPMAEMARALKEGDSE